MSNILIVGDLHGDWQKINILINKKKPDIILQCGDFGWWPILETKKLDWKLKGIKPNETKIYWCDGNHEEHSYLIQDGLIHEMYENIYFCSRGSLLTLPDKQNVLFIGGADSIDKDRRILNYDWFNEENISNSDFEKMISHKKVDIIISHTCPKSFDINILSPKINDSNRIALDHILQKYKPDLWFFGHWHKFIQGNFNGTKWTCLDYTGHIGKWWIELKKEKNESICK